MGWGTLTGLPPHAKIKSAATAVGGWPLRARGVHCCLYLDEIDVLEAENDIRFEFRTTRNPHKHKNAYWSSKVNDMTLTLNDLEEVKGHPEHVTSDSLSLK